MIKEYYNKNLKHLNILTIFMMFSLYLTNFGYKLGVTIKPYMLVVFLLVFRIGSIKLVYDRIYIVFLLYVSTYVFTSAFAFDSSLSLTLALGLILVSITLLLFRSFAYQKFKVKDFELVAKGFILLSFTYYIAGVAGFYISGSTARGVMYGAMIDRGMVRFAGIIGNPNYFSVYSLPITFYFMANGTRWFVLSLICTALTFSISAVFSFIISLVCLGYFFKSRVARFNIAIMAMLFGIVIFFSIIFWDYAPPSVLDAFYGRLDSMLRGSGRFSMWSFGYNLFQENIFLGIGLNNLQSLTKEFLQIVNIHNTYFEILIEGGAVTFILFLAVVTLVMTEAYGLSKKKSEYSWLFPAVLSSLINIMFVSATVNASLILIFLLVFLIKDSSYTNIDNK